MADETLGTAIVTDRRTKPPGVLPRSAQTWLMVALACSMLAIIVTTGRTTAPATSRPAATGQPTDPSPERLRDYQDRLRLLEQRQEPSLSTEPTGPPSLVLQEPTAIPHADPMKEEQKRRDYQSLFAANVAWSRAARGDLSAVAAPLASPPANGEKQQGIVPATQIEPTSLVTANSSKPALTARLHRIIEGTILETVLTTRLDGANAAPVNCLVTTPVYSRDREHIVIPAGARLLGQTRPVQSFGESRLAVSFHRLVLPDGSTHGLNQFPALNPAGDAALRDGVNHHYIETFGAAAAVGLISGLSQFAGSTGLGGRDSNQTIAITGGTADAGAQAVAQTMNRFLNRPPTITIREGHRVAVYLTSDLELPAYEPAVVGH